MKSNTLSLSEVLSSSALGGLQNEMALVYWRLNHFNAYEKAGNKFDEGDWGLYICLFSLGYLNGYIKNRLDEVELDQFEDIFKAAQNKYFRGFGGDDYQSLISRCWGDIQKGGEAELFYNTGILSSQRANGIVKDIVTMFVMKYDLFQK